MSRRMLASILVTTCVGLALLAVHLFRTPIDTRPIADPSATEAESSPLPRPSALRLALDGTTPAGFKETVARPLFWETRRPAPERVAAPPPKPKQVVVAAAPPEPPAVEFRLAGIVHDGANVRRALIASPQSPDGRWVEIGGQIDGWRIAGIEQRSVRIEAGGRSRELKMP